MAHFYTMSMIYFLNTRLNRALEETEKNKAALQKAKESTKVQIFMFLLSFFNGNLNILLCHQDMTRNF